jgi:hypothetical protein
LSLHVCECGRKCKSAGGLASHQRSCVVHADAARTGLAQLSLELAPSTGSTRGAIETAAAGDVAYLRDEDLVDDGVKALELSYLLMAREVDRAETEKDRYGKINAARELRSLRQQLAAFGPAVTGASLEEFWAELHAKVHHRTQP